jgi:hypothetical protein
MEKYLKYKSKYLKLKNELLLKQSGGKKIIYSPELLKIIRETTSSEDSAQNLQESVYSCIYAIMSAFKNLCDTHININCTKLFQFNFPFISSDAMDLGSCAIIKDNLHNNIVVIFGSGNRLFCDQFTKEVFMIFIHIYVKIHEFLAADPTIKYIHITGHSMGSSISILFSYFIMVLEKSSSDALYEPALKYFQVNYELKRTLNFDYFVEHFDYYLKNINPSTTSTYDKIENITTIIIKLFQILGKSLPKIGHRVSVCSVAGFPVLFEPSHLEEYYDYLSFYDSRRIIFENCDVKDTQEVTEKEMTNVPNIGSNFCDLTISNIQLYDLTTEKTIKELTNFDCRTIHDLKLIHIEKLSMKNLFLLDKEKIILMNIHLPTDVHKSNLLHNYIENYKKLKKLCMVSAED